MNRYARKALTALFLLTAFSLAAPVIASATPPGTGWTLAAADEFNGTTLSPAWDPQRFDYWLTGYPQGTAAPVTYNNMESTPYAANRNTVSGGQLHQTVSGGRTGTVNTLRSYNFTYG